MRDEKLLFIGAAVFLVGCFDLTISERPDAPVITGGCVGKACYDPPPNSCGEGCDINVFNAAGWCESGECFYKSHPDVCDPGLCSVGICEEVPCQGKTCNVAPVSSCINDTTLQVFNAVGYCDTETGLPECKYVLNTFSCDVYCEEGACDGESCEYKVCNKPPARYCDGNNLVIFDSFGQCSHGECSYAEQLIECGGECVDGQCQEVNPCQNVTCNIQPASYCMKGLLRVFDSIGHCENGACIYAHQDIPCSVQCSSGQCIAEACLGVICDQPPAPYCYDGGTLVHWDATSECEDGFCHYGTAVTTCSDGCQEGQCNASPCNGIVCQSPPADHCDGTKTLVSYDVEGTCDNGDCTYESTNTTCEDTCRGGACQEEVVPESIEQEVGPGGGTVRSGDGKFEVLIAEGALEGKLKITIDKISSEDALQDSLGLAYEVGPSGYVFASSITMLFHYEDLGNDVDENALRVATVVDNKWRPIRKGELNQVDKTVSGLTDHLSPYAVIEWVGGDTDTDTNTDTDTDIDTGTDAGIDAGVK